MSFPSDLNAWSHLRNVDDAHHDVIPIPRCKEGTEITSRAGCKLRPTVIVIFKSTVQSLFYVIAQHRSYFNKCTHAAILLR